MIHVKKFSFINALCIYIYELIKFFHFFILLCNKYFPSIFKAFCLLNTPSKSGSSWLDFCKRNWRPEALFHQRLQRWHRESSSSSQTAKNRCSRTAPFSITPLCQTEAAVTFCFTKYLLVGCLVRWKPREFQPEEDVGREIPR